MFCCVFCCFVVCFDNNFTNLNNIRLRICKISSYQCVSCGNIRRKLKGIPNYIRERYRFQQRIILKFTTKVCDYCLKHERIGQFFIDNKHLLTFDDKKHTISKKYTNWYDNKIIHLYKENIELKKQINYYQQKYDQLFSSDLIRKSIKYTNEHSKLQQDKNYYENQLKKIPAYLTGKYFNNINWNLQSSYDTYIFTGWHKQDIIKQAERSKLNVAQVFYLRHRIRHYLPYSLQSVIFGISAARLMKNWHKNIGVFAKNYAKKRLINNRKKQYWTRERIKQHIPKFAYKLRSINAESGIVILTQDGTYQLVRTVQTNHDIRKATVCGYKKNAAIVKVHIWACADSTPIYQITTGSDGQHSDGKIFESVFNKKYNQYCLEALKKGNSKEAFKNNVTIYENSVLINLLKYNDHIISDNGYIVKDPRIKQPQKPPNENDDNGRLTTIEASYRRGCSAIRQGHERIHGWVKNKYRFCSSIINCNDIKYISDVWNICLSDLVWYKVQLTQDTPESRSLTNRLLDMRYVVVNPCEIYYLPKNINKGTKKNVTNKKKKKQQSYVTDSDDDDESLSDNQSFNNESLSDNQSFNDESLSDTDDSIYNPKQDTNRKTTRKKNTNRNGNRNRNRNKNET